MSGGATPDTGGQALLLSLRRMASIRMLDIENRTATAEAGVILQTLHEAAEAAGLRFALTLGGKGSATIGGLATPQPIPIMRVRDVGCTATVPDCDAAGASADDYQAFGYDAVLGIGMRNLDTSGISTPSSDVDTVATSAERRGCGCTSTQPRLPCSDSVRR